jgi:glycosyltransferase involved in cell wall biosynthesis
MLPVLMPAFNASAYLGAAIESVLSQTVRDLQLLVIDDGSKDDTLAIAKSCAARDTRVRVETQPNAGIAHTLNRGLEMLDGHEWVFLMHADDLMTPNRLERQSAFIASADPKLAVSSSLVYYINGDGETIGTGRSPFTDPAAIDAAVARSEMIAFNHPACALRRSAVLEVGGYRQDFWPAEDCDLWSRIVERGYRVAVQDEYLLKYRIHGTSASISRARLMQQKTIWLERCIVARRAGQAEPTWTQFQAERKNVAWPTRLNHSRQELGRTFYQAAIHHVSTRNYLKLVPTLAAAAALEPGLVLSRVLPRILPRRMRAAAL